MKISLVTPASVNSGSGNRVTANRWAKILRRLGHQVKVSTEDSGQHADLLVAIHAWRSADAINAFKQRQPHAPIVVLLAGTDIYSFQHTHPETTLRSMAQADLLVGLHDRVGLDIPAEHTGKLRIVRQSSVPLASPRALLKRYFQVCVVGHLRDEKDSLRAAWAARLVPASSRLRVVSLGRAHNQAWADAAITESLTNPRFHWRNHVSRGEVRRCFSRSHAMVISSVMEGGANVVSEAIVAGLPVIASDISGNRGLLGDDHPAYFPAKDEHALARLLIRAEQEPTWLSSIASVAAPKARQFEPARELRAWKELLAGLPRAPA